MRSTWKMFPARLKWRIVTESWNCGPKRRWGISTSIMSTAGLKLTCRRTQASGWTRRAGMATLMWANSACPWITTAAMPARVALWVRAGRTSACALTAAPSSFASSNTVPLAERALAAAAYALGGGGLFQLGVNQLHGAGQHLIEREVGRVNHHSVRPGRQRRVGAGAISLVARLQFSQHRGFLCRRSRAL